VMVSRSGGPRGRRAPFGWRRVAPAVFCPSRSNARSGSPVNPQAPREVRMKIVRTRALAVLVIPAPLAPAHLSAQEEAADSLEVIPLVPLTVTVLRTPVR